MQTYTNPIARADPLGDQFADPFVMRFNGIYYLYVTAPDVPCWTSTDLVTWTRGRATIEPEEFPGLVPFAPEVFHADGAFYLVTSPHGRGHYILRGESPFGPFRKLTPNLGRALDGHVFIDDDDSWYFYWAGWEGIWGSKMRSPTELGEPVFTGAQIHGWTEGPFVTKRDGRYHMTLTGNHFLSPGYRVNSAVSDNPLTGYVDNPLNPVLLSADGPTVGLGHPSLAVGPDLVSSYLVYHSLRPDRLRELNIDRVVWTGGTLQVLGPSERAPLPSPPDAECRWPDGRAGWVTGAAIATDDTEWATMAPGEAMWEPLLVPPFTLETTLAPAPRGSATVALIDPSDRSQLSARFTARSPHVALDGRPVRLGRRYRHDAVHTVGMIHDGTVITVLLDGREVLRRPERTSQPLRLAVRAEDAGLKLGYVGMTRSTPALADTRCHQPVPGRFRATPVAHVPGAPSPLASASHRLFVARPGRYRVFLIGDQPNGGTATLRTDRESATVAAASGTVGHAVLTLEAGEQELQLTPPLDERSLSLIEVRPEVSTEPLRREQLTTAANRKTLLTAQAPLDFDLSVQVEVDRAAMSGHADLLFRASQLSLGFEGDDERLGADFLLGYSLQIHADRVRLERHDYDATLLGEWCGPLNPSLRHSLILCVRGGDFGITLDGEHIISAHDRLPHVTGGIGMRTVDAKLHLWELSVLPGPPA